MSELRAKIRELLLEELGKIKESMPSGGEDSQSREEVVSISSTADICRFASSVLTLARDPEIAKQIEQGSYPFRLSAPSGTSFRNTAANSGYSETRNAANHFEKGVVTEKDISALPAEVGQVSYGASVCLTPLARDALRRREITVVRKSS